MDPDPAIFVIDLQYASKKLIFYTIVSAYYFLKVHLHHFSKSRIHTSDKWIRLRILEAQKHVGPVDPEPDPQHCGILVMEM